MSSPTTKHASESTKQETSSTTPKEQRGRPTRKPRASKSNPSNPSGPSGILKRSRSINRNQRRSDPDGAIYQIIKGRKVVRVSWNEEQQRQLLRWYFDGLSDIQIAKRFGDCLERTVTNERVMLMGSRSEPHPIYVEMMEATKTQGKK